MNFTIKLDKLETPVFWLDGGESSDPISCLSMGRCKPLKNVSKSNVNLLILSPKQADEEEKILKKLLFDLSEGIKEEKKLKRKRWKGFQEIFGTELEFKFDNYEKSGENYVSNIFQKLDNSKDYDLVIIYMPENRRSRTEGPYFNVKVYAIENEIKEQIIIKPTIDKIKYNNNEDILKYNDLLWNLALSIFTKLGGVPWRLKIDMSPVDAFLALSTIIKPEVSGGKRRAGITVLQMYNNWGEYKSSIHGKLVYIYEETNGILNIDNNNEKESKLKELVSTIAKGVKGKNVIVHLTDLYAKSFYEKIYDILKSDKGANDVKIIRTHQTSPLRLYENIEEPSKAWPEVGVYWFLKPNKIAQLYTTGKWQYSPYTLYAVPKHAIRPIQVSLEYPETSDLTTDDLRDILWLTKLYPYMLDGPRTRIPMDLSLSYRYAQIVASDENVGKLKDITFLY